MKNCVNLAQRKKTMTKGASVLNNSELMDRVRSDAIYDLQSLGNDFQHMVAVVESIQRNYRALLTENQQIKSAILNVVNKCDCRHSQRCDRCQKLLEPITGKPQKVDRDQAQEYQLILKQLRRRTSS